MRRSRQRPPLRRCHELRERSGAAATLCAAAERGPELPTDQLTLSIARSDRDLDRWINVANQIVDADASRTVEDLRSSLGRNPQQIYLLALRDGLVVGIAKVAADARSDDHAMIVEVRVLPRHRARGVGSSLLAQATEWAREHEGRSLRVYARESEEESVSFWQHRDFEEVDREIVVALDLTAPGGIETMLAARGAPADLTITTTALRPDLLPAVYEVGAVTWGEMPANVARSMLPYADWLDAVHSNPETDPARSFIALIHEQVVGIAELQVLPAATDIAWHGFAGVLCAWRGRGIARALKARQIEWSIANGIRELRTENAVDNAPIRHLNASLGYRPVHTDLVLRRAL